MTRRHARRLRARARAVTSKRRQYITALDERRARQAVDADAIAETTDSNDQLIHTRTA